MYFMLFCFTWITFFLKETNIFTLMASVATYYFDSNAQKEGKGNVMQAFKWATITHKGSIAMGSGIHAVIHIIVRVILDN